MTTRVPSSHRPVNRSAAWLRWTWLLLLLAAFAVLPALRQNIGATAFDAATVHINQGVVYSDVTADGVLYPRWAQFLHLGLGSPVFTFRTPLAYAGMDLLHRLGLPHPLGWRVMVAAGMLAAFFGAFLLVKLLTGRRWPALLAGVVYLYAPYILRNALERGSTEAFGVFLYPWVLWGLIRLARQPSAGRLAAATLLWAAVIGFHVLAPLMLAPFALLISLLLAWRYRTAMPLLAILAGVLLTAFIWAPIIPEQSYVHIERDFQAAMASPADNPLPLDRLLAAPAVYDVARDNNNTGDAVGLLHVVLLLIGVPATVVAWRRGQREWAVALGLATLAGCLLFWMFTASADAVWKTFDSILGRLQFRSRLMGVQALAIALIAGLSLALLPRRWQAPIAALLAGGLILAALPALYTDLQHKYAGFDTTLTLPEVREAEIRSGGQAFMTFGELTPRWREAPFDQALVDELGPGFDAQAQPLAHAPAGIQVRSAQVHNQAWNLALDAAGPATLTLHLLYYPRWRAAVDGQPVELRPEPVTGYAQLDVPAGSHQVALSYARTPAEWIGLAVSALTLILLLAAWAWEIVKRRRRRASLDSTALGSQGAAVLGTATDPNFAAAGASGMAPNPHPSPISSVSPGVRPVSTLADAAPPWWLLVALTVLLAVKTVYVDPSTTWLRCASTETSVCGAEAAADVRFAGGPSLRGYTVLTDKVRPGGELRVRLTWQGAPDVAEALYSFVHVRNSQADWPVNPRTGSDIWAQDDHFTPGGLLTTDFLPGRLVQEEFRVPIPADTPPGRYYLEVGWFNPATGEQLEPLPDSVQPPLSILWRSILLPSVTVLQ